MLGVTQSSALAHFQYLSVVFEREVGNYLIKPNLSYMNEKSGNIYKLRELDISGGSYLYYESIDSQW